MIGTDKLKVKHISAIRGTTLLKNQYPKQAKSIAYAPQPAPNCRRSVKVDLDGLPLAFHLTGGEASDSRNFELLLDIGPDILPRAAITDKGYDAKSNRDGARKRGICPVIPHRATATDRPAFFPKILYKARARIEPAVGKLKRFKRITDGNSART